jgi:transcriptional regulator with XRE-family HTH domain
MATLIKTARAEKGLTQTQLSKKLGYGDPQIISAWETGRVMPSMIRIGALTKALGIPKTKAVNILVEGYRNQLETFF